MKIIVATAAAAMLFAGRAELANSPRAPAPAMSDIAAPPANP